MDKLPPSAPLPDFSAFRAHHGDTIPAHLREETVGRRPAERHQMLTDKVREFTERSGPDGAVPRQSLHVLRSLICEALQDCQFDQHELVQSRSDTLVGASLSKRASPESRQRYRDELRSLLDYAMVAGAEGPTSNRSECEIDPPFAQEPPTDLVAAIRERDAHLAVLNRASPADLGHSDCGKALSGAKGLLQALNPADVRTPDALPRWQASLADALALELEAIKAPEPKLMELINRLASHLPRSPAEEPLTTASAGRAAAAPDRRSADAQRRLKEDLTRLIDAQDKPTADPRLLRRRLEECHTLLQRALGDCSFHDQDLVRRRAGALLSLAQALERGSTPTSATPRTTVDWLRTWQAEMHSLLTLAVKEGANGLAPQRAWDPDRFWAGSDVPKGNLVELLRLRHHVVANIETATLRNPHHDLGIAQMREARDLLIDCEDHDLSHPEGLDKLRGALLALQISARVVQAGDRLARARHAQPRPQ